MAANSKIALSDCKNHQRKHQKSLPKHPAMQLLWEELKQTLQPETHNSPAILYVSVHLSGSGKILAENHPSVCEDAQSKAKRAHPKSSTYGWGFISM